MKRMLLQGALLNEIQDKPEGCQALVEAVVCASEKNI